MNHAMQPKLWPECLPRRRKFLWWSWMEDTHAWKTVREWKTYVPYGTLFWKRCICVKCDKVQDFCHEAYGP